MDTTDSVDGIPLTNKVKDFLTKKLNSSELKIKKLKKKRTIYKTLFITTASSSIIFSVVLASVSSLTLPIVVIPVLSISSGILTALSAKFSFQDKKEQLNREIKKLNKIQNTLDYVISCNGDITKEKVQEIISEFDNTI
jgi:hypothetical protein